MVKDFPKYKYVLAFCDYSLLILSFVAAVLARFYAVPLSELLDAPGLVTQIIFILAYSVIWIFIFQHFHLYKINVFLTSAGQIIAVIKGLFYGFVGLFAVSFFIKGMNWIDSRAVIAYFAVFSFFSLILFRTLIFRRLFIYAAKNQIFQRKVLIIGTDQTSKMVAAQINSDDTHGFEVVGFIDDDLPKDERIFEDYKIVGKLSELKDLVKQHGVEDIIIAQSDINHQKLFELIDASKDTPATLRLASELYKIIPEKILVEKYLGIPIVLLTQNYNNVLFNVYKRVFDVVFSIFALTLLIIPFLIIALLIKLTSKGHVFYKHTRIGKDGKPFEFYKFRTMYVNNDDSAHREFIREYMNQNGGTQKGEVKKITHDPRITSIGGFLRKTSIDELPQLFNVLRGEMSLVGPRPCLPYEWEAYETWHRRRLSVMPGCTGLWQVAGRSAVDFNDMVILDLFYINNMSPLFDLKIIFKTVPVMLLAKGGY